MKRLLILLLLLASSMATAQLISSFPDDNPQSGRFTNVTRGLKSLGAPATHFAIQARSNFTLEVFDGDMGGTWDVITTGADVTQFTLYADPNLIGDKSSQVTSWTSKDMVNDDWWTLPTSLQAGNYNLEISWATQNYTSEQNNFKLRATNGYVYVPANTTFEVIGYTPNDPNQTLFPQTTYDGTYTFRVESTNGFELWDGDWDRADSKVKPGSPLLPTFPYSVDTLPAYGWPGLPADCAIATEPISPLWVMPAVYYTVNGPGIAYTENNISGNQEWKRSTFTGIGSYELKILGADGRNTLFVHCTAPVYGTTVELPESRATRTIGYWANHPSALIGAVALGINLGQLQLECGTRDLTGLHIDVAEAILWGGISKQGAASRSDLGQARMQLGQQLVAGLANNAFGTHPEAWGFSPTLLIDAVSALNSRNVARIKSFITQVEAFNVAGDLEEFPNYRADPSRAKALAARKNGVINPGEGFE